MADVRHRLWDVQGSMLYAKTGAMLCQCCHGAQMQGEGAARSPVHGGDDRQLSVVAPVVLQAVLNRAPRLWPAVGWAGALT